MTAEEYIGELKSRIKVEPSKKENFFHLKYGDNYKQLIISNRDYMNQFLLNPLLQVLDKKEKEKLSTTIVDAVPLDKIRAYGTKVNTKEYAVVFNERLLGLISAYNEIRIVSLKELYESNPYKGNFAKNFAPLIDSYLTPNSNEALPLYSYEQLSKTDSLKAALLTIAGEQFILAHELSHILLGHFESTADKQRRYKYGASNTSQEYEYAADIKALKWIKRLIKANNHKISLEMHVEIFVLFHLIECNLGIPSKDNSHPSALDRLINLKDNCAVHFDKCGIRFMSEMIKNCQDIESFKMI